MINYNIHCNIVIRGQRGISELFVNFIKLILNNIR